MQNKSHSKNFILIISIKTFIANKANFEVLGRHIFWVSTIQPTTVIIVSSGSELTLILPVED